MAITANGMIAKKNGDSEWVSEENTKDFHELCQKIGTVIMGKNTYNLLYPDYLPLKQGTQVVLTHEQLHTDNPTIVFLNKSPEEVLSALKAKGIKEAILIGGEKVATAFMSQGLVDEIYLNVEPLFFGEGIPIVIDSEFEYKLTFIDTKQLGKNTIQLHYAVGR